MDSDHDPLKTPSLRSHSRPYYVIFRFLNCQYSFLVFVCLVFTDRHEVKTTYLLSSSVFWSLMSINCFRSVILSLLCAHRMTPSEVSFLVELKRINVVYFMFSHIHAWHYLFVFDEDDNFVNINHTFGLSKRFLILWFIPMQWSSSFFFHVALAFCINFFFF